MLLDPFADRRRPAGTASRVIPHNRIVTPDRLAVRYPVHREQLDLVEHLTHLVCRAAKEDSPEPALQTGALSIWLSRGTRPTIEPVDAERLRKRIVQRVLDIVYRLNDELPQTPIRRYHELGYVRSNFRLGLASKHDHASRAPQS